VSTQSRPPADVYGPLSPARIGEGRCGDDVSALKRLSLPPFPNRVGVDRVMAVRIEPQATSEARFPGELVIGHALDEVDEPSVGAVLLHQDIGERHISFPLGHHGVERVDATVGHGVPRWPAAGDDKR
jgi:hypothetical protein